MMDAGGSDDFSALRSTGADADGQVMASFEDGQQMQELGVGGGGGGASHGAAAGAGGGGAGGGGLPGAGSLVWESVLEKTKLRASGLQQQYNIDSLRAFFNVETRDVLKRLAHSMVPRRISPLSTAPDLYGPLMLTFTLASILTMSLKITHHAVEEGSLLGSSLFVSFAYWLGASSLYHAVSFFSTGQLSFLAVISVTVRCFVPEREREGERS